MVLPPFLDNSLELCMSFLNHFDCATVRSQIAWYIPSKFFPLSVHMFLPINLLYSCLIRYVLLFLSPHFCHALSLEQHSMAFLFKQSCIHHMTELLCSIYPMFYSYTLLLPLKVEFSFCAEIRAKIHGKDSEPVIHAGKFIFWGQLLTFWKIQPMQINRKVILNTIKLSYDEWQLNMQY